MLGRNLTVSLAVGSVSRRAATVSMTVYATVSIAQVSMTLSVSVTVVRMSSRCSMSCWGSMHNRSGHRTDASATLASIVGSQEAHILLMFGHQGLGLFYEP